MQEHRHGYEELCLGSHRNSCATLPGNSRKLKLNNSHFKQAQWIRWNLASDLNARFFCDVMNLTKATLHRFIIESGACLPLWGHSEPSCFPRCCLLLRNGRKAPPFALSPGQVINISVEIIPPESENKRLVKTSGTSSCYSDLRSEKVCDSSDPDWAPFGSSFWCLAKTLCAYQSLFAYLFCIYNAKTNTHRSWHKVHRHERSLEGRKQKSFDPLRLSGLTVWS